MSALVGITIAMLPVYSILSLVTGGVVAMIARGTGRQPTLWGGIAAYSFLLLRTPISQENTVVVVGIVALASLVLLHGVVGHRRRRVISE